MTARTDAAGQAHFAYLPDVPTTVQSGTGAPAGVSGGVVDAGEYRVRVVMFDGKAPKTHVRVGTVTVDTDRVVVRQEPEAKRG